MEEVKRNSEEEAILMTNQDKLQSFCGASKFKHGIDVTRDFTHGVKMDQKNGDSKWQDA